MPTLFTGFAVIVDNPQVPLPNRFADPNRHLKYPFNLDFEADLHAIQNLPRPDRSVLALVAFPGSIDEYISSRRYIYTHADECTCNKCRVRYQLPVGNQWRNEFKMLKRLGAGCFGATAVLKVLRGYSDDTYYSDPIVAGWHGVKVVEGTKIVAKRIASKDVEAYQDWRNEVKALTALVGCHKVVNIFAQKHPEAGDPWGHIFMDYCDLGDCHNLMDQYRQNQEHIPEGYLYYFTQDMCSALAWIHKGMIAGKVRNRGWTAWMHNDIKPDNILMRSRVKNGPTRTIYPMFVLADLGCATDENTNAMSGCRQFFTPEREAYIGRRPSKPTDDVYALGVSLYLLANLEFPYPKTKFTRGYYGQTFSDIDYSKRHRYHNPYTLWFNNLVTGMTSLIPRERLDECDIYYYIQEGINKYGISSAGSRNIRWRINWLTPAQQRAIRSEEGKPGSKGTDVPEIFRIGSGMSSSRWASTMTTLRASDSGEWPLAY